jgi:DNA-binding winged helix-turn-helix (wHTH) protein/broad specificity phosphatase PhoE
LRDPYKIQHVVIDFDDHSFLSNGIPVKIDHKALEVLQLLLEHAGNTVTTDEFMQKIWIGKPSSPEVVTSAIARLRRCFKLAGISDELVTTVPKVGYRFEAPASGPTEATTRKQSGQSKWKMAGLAIAILLLLGSLAFNWLQFQKAPTSVHTKTASSGGLQPESTSKATQIYIMRHTEKADDVTEDPLLSEAGKIRAQYWKQVLANVEIDQIYSTDLKRTVETAEILAENYQIKPEFYYPLSFDIVNFITEVQGQKVLIIGHSNTIPDMVNRLIGESTYPPMSHTDYDKLFVITINANGDTSSSLLDIELPATP